MRRILLIVLLLVLPRPSFAASVNVSTIAVASSTVTVTTASAHGQAVGSPICLSAPGSVCTVIETVPTSTTLTFTQPSTGNVAACASSCGTASTVPHAFVLPVTVPSQSVQRVQYGIWLFTTIPVPNSGAVSQWIAARNSTGATTAQVTALKAGSFIERMFFEDFPAGTPIAEMQTFIQRRWTAEQAALTGSVQPGTYYGSEWDGSAWSVQ